MITLKSHQKNALFFLGGLIVGYAIAMYLLSVSVSYKVEEAYQQGFSFGVQMHEYKLHNDMSDTTEVILFIH